MLHPTCLSCYISLKELIAITTYTFPFPLLTYSNKVQIKYFKPFQCYLYLSLKRKGNWKKGRKKEKIMHADAVENLKEAMCVCVCVWVFFGLGGLFVCACPFHNQILAMLL